MLAGLAPRTLDMCERHRKMLLDPLTELLDGRGVAGPVQRSFTPRYSLAPGDPRRSADWTCPECGQTIRRSSANGHLRNGHRWTWVKRDHCPDCDFTGNDIQVTSHRLKAHGKSQLDDLIALRRTEVGVNG